MKKIIITGNIGKTVFAYFLAEYLSKEKKVILISTDEDKAVYRCLFQSSKRSNKSFSRLLCDPVIVDKDIFNNSHLLNKRFLMISNADTTVTYPEPTIHNCAKLMLALDNLTDIVIVDSSNHVFDSHFKNSPDCLNVCVLSADIRGYHYRMKHGNGDIDLLWETNSYSLYQDSIASFKNKPIELPNIKKLNSIYNGSNISDIALNAKYLKALKTISKEIEQMEGNNTDEDIESFFTY